MGFTMEENMIKEAVLSALREHTANFLSDPIHTEHHEFLSTWIARVRQREERQEKLKTQVFGWGIITILGAIGTAAYQGVIYLRDHLK